MKETVLTNAELGEYAYNGTYDTMEYTWTDNCHNDNHGYSTSSRYCDNTNSYATSKVKKFLEGTYINTLGANNLKEVDGYKIRLITVDELTSNLGCASNGSSYTCTSSQYASWVYQNFGENKNNVYGYWSMTPHPDYSSNPRFVYSYGLVSGCAVIHNIGAVRPVIHLLKANIS